MDRPAVYGLRSTCALVVAWWKYERMTEDARSLWNAEAETFDDAADHGLRDPDVRRAWADLLLPVIGGRGRMVADLGCGTGTLSLLLAAEGGHVVSGVDFSAEMIRRGRKKSHRTIPKPSFIVADAADPPLQAGAFDVALSRHVLWAMPDPATALQNWIEPADADRPADPHRGPMEHWSRTDRRRKRQSRERASKRRGTPPAK